MKLERPRIAVTSGSTQVPIPEGSLDAHYVGRAYTRAIAEAGGWPIVFPAVEGLEEELARQAVECCHGVVLSGGVDIAPDTYGATFAPHQKPDHSRDRFEVALVNAALERSVPVLGICRGMQLINVARGGTLLEHVDHEVDGVEEGTFRGVRYHAIGLEEESLVRRVFGQRTVDVMCLHHQAPGRVGDGLVVTGRSADGIVEAVEDANPDNFLVGVQWHPEHMMDTAPLQKRLYASLVEAARVWMRRVGG